MDKRNKPLTVRERETIVAALLAWQNEIGFHNLEELRQLHPFTEVPLNLDEIDALIQRLMGRRT